MCSNRHLGLSLYMHILNWFQLRYTFGKAVRGTLKISVCINKTIPLPNRNSEPAQCEEIITQVWYRYVEYKHVHVANAKEQKKKKMTFTQNYTFRWVLHAEQEMLTFLGHLVFILLLWAVCVISFICLFWTFVFWCNTSFILFILGLQK